MARVLITGMSGAGKSTLLGALEARGFHTVDTDYDEWQGPDARWDEPRMGRLLAESPMIAVAGTAENQGRFSDRFEHVVYLLAPLDVLLGRVEGRAGNPYGHSAEQRAEIAGYVEHVEPLIRRTATVELDATLPVEELADRVEHLLRTG